MAQNLGDKAFLDWPQITLCKKLLLTKWYLHIGIKTWLATSWLAIVIINMQVHIFAEESREQENILK